MPGLWVWALAIGIWALAVVILLLTLPVRFDRAKLRGEVRYFRAAMDSAHEELGVCRVIAQGVSGWRVLAPDAGAGRDVFQLRSRLLALEEAVATAPPNVRERIQQQADRLTARARVDTTFSGQPHVRAG